MTVVTNSQTQEGAVKSGQKFTATTTSLAPSGPDKTNDRAALGHHWHPPPSPFFNPSHIKYCAPRPINPTFQEIEWQHSRRMFSF